jgi:pimeloyl-ACP methyl ester carboxylesterase
MATFVLVHGGGHGGWCWKPLAQRLRQAGHEVHAPTLTGLGERRHLLHPDVDLNTHVEDIVSLLFHEDLTNVTLVGHSYGGMVITGAADRALHRMSRLVYLDAAIPLDGEALVDTSPGLALFKDTRVVEGVELGLWPESVGVALYGLTDPELAAWAAPRLTPHPWRSFETRLRLDNAGAVAALPRAIVNCPASLSRRPPELLHRWLEGDFVRDIDTGHDLMLTEPDTVAAMLEEIAAL